MADASDKLLCGCPHCAGLIEFPPEMAGAGVDCPHCGEPVNLVEPEAGFNPGVVAGEGIETPGRSELSATALAEAFHGRVPRRGRSWAYVGALVGVCLVMLVVPAAYLGVVGGLGWALWRFAVDWIPWARDLTGGTTILPLWVAVYVVGLFVGGWVLLFLVKPIFARRARGSDSLALNPAAEPLIFAFVHMIADAVGAPRPARIDVDCRLNAAAGFRRGWWSLARQDFVLVLGLPLVAAFDARQLAGVVAHELGHFRQGVGLRASYLLRGMSAWLSRVAYERDSWDDAVAEYAANSGSGVGQALVGLARLGVWLSRSVMVVLLHASHAVSCAFLRQLERDADHCQIVVGGSDAFAQTVRRVHVLGEVSKDYYRLLRAAARAKHPLPPDFPRAIAEAELAVETEVRERWIDRALDRQPATFDTHPSDRSRLSMAEELKAPGLFRLAVPATALFSSFPTLARQVTALHYEEDLDLPRTRFRNPGRD